MDRKALARATESSDAPTPGYLYLDIAKSVSTSPKVCQDTIQYLLKRLQHKNHNIKHKTLKVIAKVVNSNHSVQFKQQVSTNPELIAAIRDASTFRGPPDPLRGMAIYDQVHEAAKEALAAIYSDAGPSSGSSGGGLGGGGGFGMAPGISASYGNPISSSYNNHNGGGMNSSMGMGGSTTRMEGIGNPNFADPRIAAEQSQGRSIRNMTVSEVIGNVQETVVNMVKDPLARNVQMPQSGARHSELPGYGRPSIGSPPGRSQLAASTNGQWTMASNRGPNAVQPPGGGGFGNDPDRDAYQRQKSPYGGQPQNSFAPVNGSVFGSWGKAGASTSGPTSSAHIQSQPPQYHSSSMSYVSGSGGTAVSDGSYERNLIAELCPPGGMKAEPPQDKLEQFERNVSRLNADLVCPVLLDNLEDGTPWIVKAKALCVIHRTIRATAHMDPNPYGDFFHACAEEIQPLANHPRAAIRDPARNVLKELGMEVQEQVPSNEDLTTVGNTVVAPPTQPPPAPPAHEIDLLDLAGGGDLVGDQNVPPPPPQTQPPPPPPAEKASTNGMSSLFGGLTVQDRTSTSSSTAAVPNGASANGSSNLLDGNNVFSETTTSTNTTADAASATSFLNTPADAGMKSGFGFLNNSGPTTVATEPRDQPSTSNTPPSNSASQENKSFDPLLSLNWNSQPTQPMMSTNATTVVMSPPKQQGYGGASAMMRSASMHNGELMDTMAAAGMGAYPNAMHSPNRTAMMRGHSMTGRMMPLVQSPKHTNAQAVAGGGTNSFSFYMNEMAEKKKQQDQSFDFIKDAMKTKK